MVKKKKIKKNIDRCFHSLKGKIIVEFFNKIRKTKNNDQYFRLERVRCCVVMIIIAHTYTAVYDRRTRGVPPLPPFTISSLETRVNTSYIIL